MVKFTVIIEYKINDVPLEKETVQIDNSSVQSVEVLKHLIYDLRSNRNLKIWQIWASYDVVSPDDAWQYTINNVIQRDLLTLDEETNIMERNGLLAPTELDIAWVNALPPENHNDKYEYGSVNHAVSDKQSEVWIYTGQSVTNKLCKTIPFDLAFEGLLHFINAEDAKYSEITWEKL